jgi:ornithine cyclodeaminase
MIVLAGADVRRLLTMPDAIGCAREAMCAFSGGQVTQPLRTVINGGVAGLFGAMPVHVSGGPATGFGIKTVVVKHDNAERGLPSHLGLVVVFDQDTGLPKATLDAATITEIRTAAVSAIATDALSSPTSSDLAILGTGAQARAHLEAIGCVRSLSRIRVWGRTPERAEQLSRWAKEHLGMDVEVRQTPHEACVGADIICTTTSSRVPVLDADSVKNGAHVNAVGACQPGARELPTELVVRASVFVDSRRAALAESDDLLVPIKEGRLTADAIVAELGEVLLGRNPGRTSATEVTIFESVGLAVQDVVTGFEVATRAEQQGIGQQATLLPG